MCKGIGKHLSNLLEQVSDCLGAKAGFGLQSSSQAESDPTSGSMASRGGVGGIGEPHGLM